MSRKMNRGKEHATPGNVLRFSDKFSALKQYLYEEKRDPPEIQKSIEIEHELLRSIFDLVPGGLLVTDSEGIILEVNRLASSLLNAFNELKGRSLVSLVAEKDRPAFISILTQLQNSLVDQVQGRKLEMLAFGHGSVALSLSVAAVRPSEANMPVFCWLLDDISKHKDSKQLQRKSEERTRRFFESNIIGIFFVDSRGIVTDGNDAFLSMSGYLREDLLAGKVRWERLTPEEYRQIDEWIIDHIKEKGYCAPWEKEYIHKDGTRFPVLASVALLTVYPETYVCLTIDITERKRAEKALHQSEEQLRLALSAAEMGTWRWDIEADLEYRDASFNLILGLDPLDSAQPIDDLVKRIHPIDRLRIMEELERAVREKGLFNEQFRITRPDGTIRWVRSQAKIIRNQSGNSSYLTGIMKDITELKQSEQQLREQAALLHITPNAIVVLDMEDTIVFWNKSAERVYGWTAIEAIGRSIRELILRTSDQEQFEEARDKTLKDGYWSGEMSHQKKSGDEIIIESHLALVPDEDNRPSSILLTNRDVTGRKALEAQMIKAQKMESIGTMAAGIAHDLNSMLSPILMVVDKLRLKRKDQESQHLLAMLQLNVESGMALVNRLLSLASSPAKVWTQVQPRSLIIEIVGMLRVGLPNGIETELVIQDHLWSIRSDATQLHQVISNLLINARDSILNTGKIIIKAENVIVDGEKDHKLGHYVLLTVSDTGTGIAPEVIDNIYEPFFTTKNSSKGTGLGLSIVLAIVKELDGFIEVKSDVDKGTEFKIYLPASEMEAGE